jgi:hypothetical protein
MGDDVRNLTTARLDIAYTDAREMACPRASKVAHKWYCLATQNWLFPVQPSATQRVKMVTQQANIAATAPATCMPLLIVRQSHSTRVYVSSVLYDELRNVLRITQQDEFFARLPKAHYATRIVARTERT